MIRGPLVFIQHLLRLEIAGKIRLASQQIRRFFRLKETTSPSLRTLTDLRRFLTSVLEGGAGADAGAAAGADAGADADAGASDDPAADPAVASSFSMSITGSSPSDTDDFNDSTAAKSATPLKLDAFR